MKGSYRTGPDRAAGEGGGVGDRGARLPPDKSSSLVSCPLRPAECMKGAFLGLVSACNPLLQTLNGSPAPKANPLV